MSLKLEPVNLADRAAIAEIIIKANWNDRYAQALWPGSTLESRIAGSYARLPSSLLEEGAWFQKVTLDGKPIAYSQWTLPKQIWQKVKEENGGGIEAEVDEEMKKKLVQEGDDSCDEHGNPRGMRVEVIKACGPPMREANKKAFPQNEEYIMLNQVKTLPAFQRKGAGSLLMEWGVELAKRENLKICLEATGFGLPLYNKFGFKNVGEVHHDVSPFGGPSRYTHTLMVKEP